MSKNYYQNKCNELRALLKGLYIGMFTMVCIASFIISFQYEIIKDKKTTIEQFNITVATHEDTITANYVEIERLRAEQRYIIDICPTVKKYVQAYEAE